MVRIKVFSSYKVKHVVTDFSFYRYQMLLAFTELRDFSTFAYVCYPVFYDLMLIAYYLTYYLLIAY